MPAVPEFPDGWKIGNPDAIIGTLNTSWRILDLMNTHGSKFPRGAPKWVRPEAPVIDNGGSVGDNELFPGTKSSDLDGLISFYLTQ